MEQIIIGITGALAILFSQQKKYPNLIILGPVIGIISQPFWFYVTYQAQQWGMFFLCFIYMYAWVVGLVNNLEDIKKIKISLKHILNPKYGFMTIKLRNNKTEIVLFKDCFTDPRLNPSMYNRKVFIKMKDKDKWGLDPWSHSFNYLFPIITFRQLIRYVRYFKKMRQEDTDADYSFILDTSSLDKTIDLLKKP